MTKRNPHDPCMFCGKEFYRPQSRKGKYCSRKCYAAAKREQPRDPNLNYRPPKGNVPWNKGKGRRETACGQCGKPISVLDKQGTRFCSRRCVSDSQRKPDDQLSYGLLHLRMRERYGTPSVCEHCGTTESKKFEWANISGEYRLDRDDWARLCCQCHRRYDLGVKNKIEHIRGIA